MYDMCLQAPLVSELKISLYDVFNKFTAIILLELD